MNATLRMVGSLLLLGACSSDQGTEPLQGAWGGDAVTLPSGPVPPFTARRGQTRSSAEVCRL